MWSALGSFWRQGRHAERAAYVIGVLLLLSGLLHIAIIVSTGASLSGPLSLRKPATFGLSFGLTVMTIAWVSSFLRLSDRTRTLSLVVFTAASALETTLVTLQSWRGVPSHFNMETTFDATVARTLAAGGAALVAVIVMMTFAAFRLNATVPLSLRTAIRIGFVTLIGSMAAGATMIARGMALVFSGNSEAAYRTAGALRPTHAVLMHGILMLPVLAWLLSFANLSERRRLGVVLTAASVYVVIAGIVAFENLAGS